MPWWLVLYLLGYGGFTVAWVRDDLRESKRLGFLAAELASDACMVIAALGYWLQSVRSFIGNFAIPVFAAGLAWLLLAAVREFRQHFPDPELPPHLNVAAGLSGILLLCLVCGPLVYWGFSYAVLGNRVGT